MRAMTRVLACFIVTVPLLALGPAHDVTLQLREFVEFPITGRIDGTGQTDGMLARINSLREEPGGATRLFVNDLNGPLYIVDKASRRVTTYLDFNGREGHRGLFRRFAYETGYANGLNSFHKPGYSGPCPPAGAPHRYDFTLRALSQSGRVLAEASLAGRFGR